ncbi:hypothetical protein Leryth_008040 [Lithospermum erythrorhizon]|nr:hypothetical protein Leryth_008040 [Lithospermum erythrorhizon]
MELGSRHGRREDSVQESLFEHTNVEEVQLPGVMSTILLRQKDMQESNISSGIIRDRLFEHKRNIYSKTSPFCMQ